MLSYHRSAPFLVSFILSPPPLFRKICGYELIVLEGGFYSNFPTGILKFNLLSEHARPVEDLQKQALMRQGSLSSSLGEKHIYGGYVAKYVYILKH